MLDLELLHCIDLKFIPYAPQIANVKSYTMNTPLAVVFIAKERIIPVRLLSNLIHIIIIMSTLIPDNYCRAILFVIKIKYQVVFCVFCKLHIIPCLHRRN